VLKYFFLAQIAVIAFLKAGIITAEVENP